MGEETEGMITGLCLFLLSGLVAVSIARTDYHTKMDHYLYNRLLGNHSGGETQEIRIVGQCALTITPRIVQIFTRTGITILTVTGSVFIAKGTARQIEQLARHSLVTSLRLSVIQAAKE